MHKVVLPNGLTVLFERKRGYAVVVEVMIRIGSNQENARERGISHFLEHLLFEGTAKRPTNLEISNEIERIGGEFNAYTTNERTCFYVKVLKKHLPKALEILSDILMNPLFKREHIEKEKKIVLKEIDMVNDEPSYYQWILLQKTLFTTHPARHPTYGDKKVIAGLTRENINSYFERYYVPGNMVVSIVGDLQGEEKEVARYFTFPYVKKAARIKIAAEPERRAIVKREKKDIANSRLIVAFRTVERIHKDSYVLEIIDAILGRGQSGRMFTEIRTKRGLAYEVGTQHVSEGSFGYFATYASIDNENVPLVRKLITCELERLQEISAQDLREAKTYIEGDFLLDLEDVQKFADQLLFWQDVKDVSLMQAYLKKIRAVSIDDVKRVARKYFRNPTTVILEGK